MSPAIPHKPYDVKLNTIYECVKYKNKYIIKGLDFEREFSLEFIKSMFKPCENYNWNMLEYGDEINNNKQNKNIINKKNKKGGI